MSKLELVPPGCSSAGPWHRSAVAVAVARGQDARTLGEQQSHIRRIEYLYSGRDIFNPAR